MPSEVICPACGRSVLIGARGDSPAANAPAAVARTIELVIPGTISGSVDGLDVPDVSLASPSPDVSMGSFVYGDPARPAPPAGLPGERVPIAAEPPLPFRDPLSVLTFDPPPARLESSDDAMEALGELEPGGARWPLILLGSYASALTLALLWLILTGRVRGREPAAPATLPTDSRPDLIQAPIRSERPPIAPDRLTTIGRPIRVGSLELTPLGVRVGRVTLVHAIAGRRQTRPGGSNALSLRLRLRNLSVKDPLIPLEREDVREPDRGLPASFLETAEVGTIDVFPLAAQSEWSIEGQSFPRLEPGEQAETVIVSEPDALGRVADPLTWRMRVHTGPDREDVIGVRFGVDEIRRGGR
jgi:hypothetical protein